MCICMYVYVYVSYIYIYVCYVYIIYIYMYISRIYIYMWKFQNIWRHDQDKHILQNTVEYIYIYIDINT